VSWVGYLTPDSFVGLNAKQVISTGDQILAISYLNGNNFEILTKLIYALLNLMHDSKLASANKSEHRWYTA